MKVYSASRRGHLNVWECNLNTADLIPKIKRVQKKKGECTLTSGQDDDGDSSMEDECVCLHSNIYIFFDLYIYSYEVTLA